MSTKNSRIMEKVYEFETKRTFFSVGTKLLLISVTIGVFTLLFDGVLDILYRQQTSVLFLLLKENSEVVGEHLLDVLETIYMELPKEYILILISCVLFIGFVALLLYKRRLVIKNKIVALWHHFAQNR